MTRLVRWREPRKWAKIEGSVTFDLDKDKYLYHRFIEMLMGQGYEVILWDA